MNDAARHEKNKGDVILVTGIRWVLTYCEQAIECLMCLPKN
jgi:hypothetical protein